MTHMHHLQGWTGVFIGIVALGAAAGAQLAASDTQTILIVGGEIIPAIEAVLTKCPPSPWLSINGTKVSMPV